MTITSPSQRQPIAGGAIDLAQPRALPWSEREDHAGLHFEVQTKGAHSGWVLLWMLLALLAVLIPAQRLFFSMGCYLAWLLVSPFVNLVLARPINSVVERTRPVWRVQLSLDRRNLHLSPAWRGGQSYDTPVDHIERFVVAAQAAPTAAYSAWPLRMLTRDHRSFVLPLPLSHEHAHSMAARLNAALDHVRSARGYRD